MSAYFSSGKILLTSEYVVLDGAIAYAFPTKLGQSMTVTPIQGRAIIHWQAYHQGLLWLDCKLDFDTETILESNLANAAQLVLKLVLFIKKHSITQLKNHQSFRISTHLEFPSNFGLGSSSSLIANLAKWSHVDAFAMNESCLGGSGYDIAVALEHHALSFQKKENHNQVKKVNWDPLFLSDLVFVHLNQKQDSREGIKHYRLQEKKPKFIHEMSALSQSIFDASTLEEFSHFTQIHEHKLSHFLEIPTIKEQLFSDCPSFIKSLGAWGGDFVLTSKFVGFEIYFSSKNYTTHISWEDLII